MDPDYNFKVASDYIRQAAEGGASLALLPEYHLTNWDPESEHFAPLAARAHEYVRKYQDLAQELSINIVPGTIVSTPESAAISYSSGADGDKWSGAAKDAGTSKPVLHNISPFISATGEVLGSYTKKNLWHPERPHLSTLTSDTSSPPHKVIQTPLGPVGILICWDLAFPEAFRALVRQGAKIIIQPTFWLATDCSAEGLSYNPNAEALFLSSTLTARAYESTAAVVFCNAGGPAEKGYLGLSQVAMPLVGPVKGSFTDASEGMRIVELDMEVLEAAERNYKVREDLGREDWHYGYSHE